VADSRDIYDAGALYQGAARLCRPGGPASTRDLKVIEQREGQDGHPFTVLANNQYQYVFYEWKRGEPSRSYVADLATGQHFAMYDDSNNGNQPCQPMAIK
jgi:hypothetical protein